MQRITAGGLLAGIRGLGCQVDRPGAEGGEGHGVVRDIDLYPAIEAEDNSVLLYKVWKAVPLGPCQVAIPLWRRQVQPCVYDSGK